MYSKCGSTNKARELLDKMSSRDFVSRNAMVTKFVGCLKEMLSHGMQWSQYIVGNVCKTLS